jgi:oxaloacetate decarboxylase gamma subunit
MLNECAIDNNNNKWGCYMNVSHLLAEAGILMGVGMGVVFVFLTFLIYATKLLTSIAQSFPEKKAAAPTQIKPISSGGTSKANEQVVAAISAAISQYRKKNK